MIEVVLLSIIFIGIIILVYQNIKKNKPELNKEDELGNLTKINTGIDDLKIRTQNIENLFSGGPRAIGVIGETHMFSLVQEILSEAQYIKNQKINNDTVECAIKIKETLCPCDSYFGTRELDKINKAINEGNKEKLIEARKEFGKALVRKAREVKQKYISPPTTTPFAVVYLPSEGAFIEAIKLKDANGDLVVPMLRKLYHVIIVGPSTFTSFLDSLLVGFETLQITKDASRIYDDLEKLTLKFSTHFSQIEDVQNKIAKASEASSKFISSATSIKSILEGIKKPKD